MGNIIAIGVVAIVVGLAIYKMYKDKKQGKHCSGCSACPSQSDCESKR